MPEELDIELEVERLMNEIDPIFKNQIKNALTKQDQNFHVVTIASVYLNKAMQAARASMGDEATVDWLLAIAENIYDESVDYEDEGERPTLH